MNDLLPYVGTSTDFGLHWPAWIAGGGFVLFCLLGLYAAILLFAGERLPMRARFIQLPTLRGRMVLGFILAGTLPAISLALVLSERTTDERLERTAIILQSQARNISAFADYFLQKSAANLDSLAQQLNPAADDGSKAIAEILQRSHPGTPGFKMLIAADTSGSVLAATRMVDRQAGIFPEPVASIADRDYFDQPMKTGSIYRSEMINDPALDSAPTAVVSVPIKNPDGSVSGILIGAYNLENYSRIQNHLPMRNGIQSLLLDRDGRVLFASESSGYQIFDDLTGKSVLSTDRPAEGAIFNFEQATGDDAGQRYLATHFSLDNGWQIFLFRSLKELEFALLDEYGVALAWLTGTLLISVFLGLALTRGISGPLEALDKSIQDFQLNVNQERADPPTGAPREVLAIFQHLGSLEKRLRATYRKLHKALKQGEKLRGELIYVIANREKEIEQRTDELEQANETLERLSREDALTGLANRRWFAQFLARAWQGAIRQQQALSILIVDIDDFKAYNDNYGHQKGDSCLKIVSEAIRRSAGRASDLVSRYGGEEFVIVLGDTALDGALKVAEDIRSTVESLGVPHKGSKFHRYVTVSIGVTSTLPSANVQPETILVAADRAMYVAKNEGKNQVAYSTAVGTGVYQALCLPTGHTSLIS